MSIRSVDAVERTVHKTNQWLSETADELGDDDREKAWRVLRAYLHALRDRLNVAEAAQLAAQLPHMLRGVFYEGFDPDRLPLKVRDREAFLDRIAEEALLSGTGEASFAATAATRVLVSHISSGEFDDVLAQLPAEIRAELARA